MSQSGLDDLAGHAIDRLELSPATKQELKAIQAELLAGYQQSLVEMVDAIQRQASTLERLQNTLNLPVGHLAPSLAGRIPAALRVAGSDEDPDIASAVVVADPIAAGYTLTQTRIAEAPNISSGDVSVLIRTFGIIADGECAVTVRKGTKHDVVYYHARAIEKLREGVASPPTKLNRNERLTLERVRRKLFLQR